MISYDSQCGSAAYLRKRVLPDLLHSLGAWRVWTHMGIQVIRNRYRRSTLGVLWIFLHSLVFAGAVSVIYGKLFQINIAFFLPYLLAGFNIWGLILASVIEGGNSFVVAEGYIKQMSFPKQVYLLRSLTASLTHALACFVVFFIATPLVGLRFSLGTLWFLPGLVLLSICCLAHIWIMAYLSARFRDLTHMMAALFQILYFTLPIIYPEQLLARRGYGFVFLYNPLYWLITIVRHPLLYREAPPAWLWWLAAAYALVLWIIAFLVAAKTDRKVVYWL